MLLLKRNRSPNQGLWSPPGGKLDLGSGESPFASAAREAQEELCIPVRHSDLHLMGIVSEQGAEGHWLMFLFRLLPPLVEIPPSHPEGAFNFFTRAEMEKIPLPETDKESIWPLFWRNRKGFFVAHCEITETGREWSIDQEIHSGKA